MRTKPEIRVALTSDGDIEACTRTPGCALCVVIDARTGNVIKSNVHSTSNAFRWLVVEARKFQGGRT